MPITGGQGTRQILIIFQTLAMAAATPTEVHQPPRFDTDYAPVGIDNWCSACISHCIEDFIDTPRPSNQVVLEAPRPKKSREEVSGGGGKMIMEWSMTKPSWIHTMYHKESLLAIPSTLDACHKESKGNPGENQMRQIQRQHSTWKPKRNYATIFVALVQLVRRQWSLPRSSMDIYQKKKHKPHIKKSYAWTWRKVHII